MCCIVFVVVLRGNGSGDDGGYSNIFRLQHTVAITAAAAEAVTAVPPYKRFAHKLANFVYIMNKSVVVFGIIGYCYNNKC